MSRFEAERIPATAVTSLPVVCPSLRGGACQIYPDRPLLCRAWGQVDDPLMRCPHGCADHLLTHREMLTLWRRLLRIDTTLYGDT